jgi:predicted phosphodiesterase
MKILLLSDLHIEFTNNDYPTPQVDCDVIVLAGDIGVGLNGIKLANKWNDELNVPIVIINGNHEYYGNSPLMSFSEIQIRQKTLGNKNVHFLENSSIIIDDVRFLGCTLWTNFRTDKKLTQEQEMYQSKHLLNDYRLCYYELGHILTPQHTLEMHNKSRKWLNKELKKPFDDKTVVVTHHSPVLNGTNPIYLGDKNGGFCNMMDKFIKKHNKSINAWFFGHTHYNIDLDVHGVRLASNQCGYHGENVIGFDVFKIINV